MSEEQDGLLEENKDEEGSDFSSALTSLRQHLSDAQDDFSEADTEEDNYTGEELLEEEPVLEFEEETMLEEPVEEMAIEDEVYEYDESSELEYEPAEESTEELAIEEEPVLEFEDTTEEEPVLEFEDTTEEEPVLEFEDTTEEEPVLEFEDTTEEEPVLEFEDTSVQPVSVVEETVEISSDGSNGGFNLSNLSRLLEELKSECERVAEMRKSVAKAREMIREISDSLKS